MKSMKSLLVAAFCMHMTAGAQVPGSGHIPISATGQVPVASGAQPTPATNAQIAGMPKALDPVPLPAGKSYTLDEVKKGIVMGAMKRRWRLESESGGTVRLILDGRADRAELVLDVVYDTNGYQFKYVRSVGLGLPNAKSATGNPNSNTISRSFEQEAVAPPNAYKNWTKNLTDSINAELIMLKL